MLISIERLMRRDASLPPAIKLEAVNPESIERVRDAEVKGIDEACVAIQLNGEWLECLGTVQEVLRAVNEIVTGGEDASGEVPAPNNDRA